MKYRTQLVRLAHESRYHLKLILHFQMQIHVKLLIDLPEAAMISGNEFSHANADWAPCTDCPLD